MPGLVRKLLICAAADGLLLHPIGGHRDRDPASSASVTIAYGTSNRIAPALSSQHSKRTGADHDEDSDDTAASLEAWGIVGLLNLASSSYLVSITRRTQVAQVYGKPVFEIRDVALIPLTSRAEAEDALRAAKKRGGRESGVLRDGIIEETDDSGTEGEESETGSVAPDADHTPPNASVESLADLNDGSGGKGDAEEVVKNVLKERGKYGRFASKWFSRGGWAVEGRKRQGMGSQEALAADKPEGETKSENEESVVEPAVKIAGESVQDETKAVEAPEELKTEVEEAKPVSNDKVEKKNTVIEALTPRILRTARLYYSSSGFFFSYDHDLSRSLLHRDQSAPSTPLWRRFDSLFFWNRHLVDPFVKAGQDSFIIPLLQGFIGQREFSITRTEETKTDAVVDEPALSNTGDLNSTEPTSENREYLLLTLVSRRSVNRAGLRYLRRGIDERGNVANNVETEQILSTQSWDASKKSFALTQIRGSIPVFFSQTPYSFKPLPTLFGSDLTNRTAFKAHFDGLAKRYGEVQAACLIDKHGTEVNIGKEYERHVFILNEHGGINGKPLAFEWFDFHGACKGMKFENVSLLLDSLQENLTRYGWSVQQNEKGIQQQNGVLRTNCMDCLDRTNVVQSAVGGWALERQLGDLGLKIDLKADPKTQWFNTLWADNGDYISKQYAGTSALKGDFTRTRKRNWTGMLSDFSLTLNRYYNNLFGDYFLQTCIDFYLGNSVASVFDDFEADMMSQDYALDMHRIRQNAIDTCTKIVLEDPDEEPVAGWTLGCPHEANTLRSLPFEECIVLLTESALYFCRFDWTTEKVGSFERIDLLDISEIWRGAYITSTLAAPHMDESKNVGFALRYKTSGQAIVRTNTRSLQNEVAADEENANLNEVQKQALPAKVDTETRLLAFKALPPKASATQKDGEHQEQNQSEQVVVRNICDEVHRLITQAVRKDRGVDHLEIDKVPAVAEKDVISLAEAKKSTGFIESIGYSLKKMVWS